MSNRLTCPQGHQWEAPGNDASTTLGQRAHCPVCGVAVDSSDGNGSDPEQTLFAKPKLAPDDSPPTLPGSDAPVDDGPHELPTVAGYLILEELGRGGMGVVYKARQEGLNRIVALKMVLAGTHAGPKSLGRFKSEAEAVARLQHPHIVQIYEVGEQDGRPYFSLEYLDGGSLAKRLAGTPQSPTAAAEMVETLARAIHYAHERGIIHRDLKPANILLQRSEVRGQRSEVGSHRLETPRQGPSDLCPLTSDLCVKITDFGLAKQLESASGMSHSGGVVGTPSYMAPEQAGGRANEVGPTADVYSLGAVLYELITGRAPFRGETALDTMLQVLSEEPVPPSRLQPKVPPDLETICLKCLEKEPRRRYQSALDLADELRCFLNHEPIRARPIGVGERGVRWCRRNPVLAGVSGLALLSLLGVVALSVGFGIHHERDALRFQREKDATKAALDEATEQKRQLLIADEKKRRFEHLSASLALDQGLRLCEQGEVHRGILWLARSLEVAPPDAADLHRAIRANLDRWRGSLHTLKNCLEHPGSVLAVAFSANGKLMLTGSEDGTARFWDAATGAAVGPTFRHGSFVTSVAFGPGDRTVLTGSYDGTARLWDAQSGKAIGEPFKHAGAVSAVAFSPNGKRIATACFDTAQIWDVTSGGGVGDPLKHDKLVTSIAFAPDGRSLVTGSLDQNAQVWDATSGKAVGDPWQHSDSVMAVAYSPDGTRVLTGCGRNAKTAQLWDVATGKPVGPALVHRDRVGAVAFSPDGKTLLTGSWDKTARLWDAETGKRIGIPLPHRGEVRAVAFSPDRVSFATGSTDRTARLWEAALERPNRPRLTHKAVVTAVAFAPDGQAVLTGDYDNVVRFWNAVSGQPLRLELAHPSPVMALAVSPDGGTIVTGTNDDRAQIWDAPSGKMRFARLPHNNAVPAVAFAPDGKAVLTGSWDKTARLWDPKTGQPLGEPIRHPDKVTAVAVSPDGRTIATGCEDRLVRLFETATGKTVGKPLAHPDFVLAVAFSPNGKVLLTGCQDKAARFWDIAAGATVDSPLQHQGAVCCVAFAPDGRTVATGSDDNTARLWEAATGKPLGPPLQHLDRVGAVAFSADGKTVMTGSDDKTARLWDAPRQWPGDVEQIVLWAQVITGMELDQRGTIHELAVPAWLDCKKRLDAWLAPPAPIADGSRP